MDNQPSLPKHRTFGFFASLLIVVGIAITVFLSRQEQDIRQRAQGESMDFVNSAGAGLGGSTNSQTVRVKLIYNPGGTNTNIPTNTPVPGAPTATTTPSQNVCAPNEGNCVSGGVALVSTNPFVTSPLPNVTVSLSGPTTHTAVTNASGAYKITGLTTGTYTISVPPSVSGNPIYLRSLSCPSPPPNGGLCPGISASQPALMNQGTFTVSNAAPTFLAVFSYASASSSLPTLAPTTPAAGTFGIFGTVRTLTPAGTWFPQYGAKVFLCTNSSLSNCNEVKTADTTTSSTPPNFSLSGVPAGTYYLIASMTAPAPCRTIFCPFPVDQHCESQSVAVTLPPDVSGINLDMTCQ